MKLNNSMLLILDDHSRALCRRVRVPVAIHRGFVVELSDGQQDGSRRGETTSWTSRVEDKSNPRHTFDLDLPSHWEHVLNICAVLLVCMLGFLFGFFA